MPKSRLDKKQGELKGRCKGDVCVKSKLNDDAIESRENNLNAFALLFGSLLYNMSLKPLCY